MAPPATNPDLLDGEETESLVGVRLGNYVLEQVIGRGGMGTVYRGMHVYLKRPAAVKVLHRRYFDNQDARHRFLHEAQAASVIDHPNIIGVNDFGEAPDGTIFLVMAHVEGIGLDRLLRRERTLALFRTIGIVNQVTRALGAAHAKGVVHRDLKPENIMLAPRSGRREIIRRMPDDDEIVEMEPAYDFVTILDFGAAKFWQQSTAPLGQNATVIGTPAYMAPETARTGVADARSDVYSVGVIFYEMLTGTVPFDGDTAVEIMIKHVSEPVEAPRKRNGSVEITEESERVILKALHKRPAQRYQSMEEFGADLQNCFGRVRFRRPIRPPGGSFESLRAPVQLTPDKLKRRPQTADGAVPQGLRTTPSGQIVLGGERAPSGSAPILLTKRKSGRHDTLSSQLAVPVPVPVPAPGAHDDVDDYDVIYEDER
jgi:serine/threonine protein kinase